MDQALEDVNLMTHSYFVRILHGLFFILYLGVETRFSENLCKDSCFNVLCLGTEGELMLLAIYESHKTSKLFFEMHTISLHHGP